jgi:16S rRNA (adenine1518-N6/adenine1519-N6)-dimethyltransferase
MMKLSEMKQILAGGNIRLSKSLGQNFLHDGNQLRRIVAAGELTASDRVLEIGPGLGPLTDLLLAQAGNVLAVEKDRRLVDVLLDSMAVGGGLDRGVRPKLLLVHDDALKFLRRESRDWGDWKMVSNLPYSAAARILVELAQATGCPERMVVTVQREVAQRIIANPGDEDYGLLTLLLQLRYEPHGWFKVPADCFFPRPDVDSACVTLLRRSKPLLDPEQTATFTKIVKRAFSQRRKMMLKLLREDWPQDWLSRWFRAGGLTTEVRAERVGLNEFVRLAELLHANQNSCHAGRDS